MEPTDDERAGCHFVLPGDTLTGIAIRRDVTVVELARLNGISHPSRLRPNT